jgi:hypothetical protein
MSHTTRASRRALIVSIAASLAAARGVTPLLAQDADVVSPESPTIVSTGRGEVPSFGGRRPGPFNWPPIERATAAGVEPTGLRIEKAGIDASIENLRVVDGQMPDPTGPWVVSWYENLGRLASNDNVVMAGHIDYWNVGPSVFYNLAALQPGDLIEVFGADGQDYAYAIDWIEQFDADRIDMDAVVGPTGGDALTLITCGGVFDYANGRYLQRTIVRASRA